MQNHISVCNTQLLNNSVKELNFYGKNVGSKVAQLISVTLRTNTSLTVLNLNCMLGKWAIGDIGALMISDSLTINSTLKQLKLRNNKLSEAGAQSLGDALKFNNSLSGLMLGHNRIGDKGAQILARILTINTTLTTLDLQNTSIGDVGCISLCTALKKILLSQHWVSR